MLRNNYMNMHVSGPSTGTFVESFFITITSSISTEFVWFVACKENTNSVRNNALLPHLLYDSALVQEPLPLVNEVRFQVVTSVHL